MALQELVQDRSEVRHDRANSDDPPQVVNADRSRYLRLGVCNTRLTMCKQASFILLKMNCSLDGKIVSHMWLERESLKRRM